MQSRRHFLQRSTCLLAAASLARALGASPPAETLGLGYGNYGMKTMPLTEAVAQCARIGYRNFEFTLYPGYSTNPDVMSASERRAVAQQLRDLGLGASCLKSRPDTGASGEARLRADQQVMAAARLALDLAVPSPPLVAVHAGGRTADWDALKQFILEQVGSWTSICSGLGVPLAIKAHAGNAVDRPERLLWLLERTPKLKIVFDHSHFSLLDLKLEDCLRALRPHLAMIQVKDARHTADGKHEFLLPGDGGTDYVRYFRELDRLGFAGPVVVEVSAQIFNRPEYDPVKAAMHSYKVLSNALQNRRKN